MTPFPAPATASFLSLFMGLVVCYVVLSIFYVFPSGYPQPSDLIMAIAVGLTCLYYVLQNKLILTRNALALSLFLGVVMCINAVHFLSFNDPFFLFSSAFYLYNAGVFATLTILFTLKPQSTRRWLRIAFIIAVFLESLFLININAINMREIGTFNNPNQLGYWALLVASCLYLLKPENEKYSWLDYLALAVLTLAALMSLSRGVIAGFPFILALFIFARQTPVILRYGLLIITVFLALTMGLKFITNPDTASQIDVIGPVIDRFSQTGEFSHDNIEGRGYNRLIDYPHYVLLGAGEGRYDRFNSDLEFHSGLGNILFSYGIIGFALFSAFLYGIFKKAPLKVWLAVIPILFYSLTHQSFRFTLFWVFLAICYHVKKEYVMTKHLR